MNEFGRGWGYSKPSGISMYAALVTILMGHGANAQVPCNPAIDGTYCATAGIPNQSQFLDSPKRDGLGAVVSGAGFYEQPATLGAITFGSRGRCIGLIRRASCKD